MLLVILIMILCYCRDLLHPEVPSKDIGLREDAQGRIFFVGAREEAVSSLEQAFAFLDKGGWGGHEEKEGVREEHQH